MEPANLEANGATTKIAIIQCEAKMKAYIKNVDYKDNCKFDFKIL